MSMKIRLLDGATAGIDRTEFSRILAELGVSEPSARRIESGKVQPSVKFIAALCRSTEQPFEELFEVVDTAEVTR